MTYIVTLQNPNWHRTNYEMIDDNITSLEDVKAEILSIGKDDSVILDSEALSGISKSSVIRFESHQMGFPVTVESSPVRVGVWFI